MRILLDYGTMWATLDIYFSLCFPFENWMNLQLQPCLLKKFCFKLPFCFGQSIFKSSSLHLGKRSHHLFPETRPLVFALMKIFFFCTKLFLKEVTVAQTLRMNPQRNLTVLKKHSTYFPVGRNRTLIQVLLQMLVANVLWHAFKQRREGWQGTTIQCWRTYGGQRSLRYGTLGGGGL